MSAFLPPFPPGDHHDVADYDPDDVVLGYLECQPGDDAPGGNHAPGYRWGWLNRHRDRTRRPDGFDQIRNDYLRATRGTGDHPGPVPEGPRPPDEFFRQIERECAAYGLDRETSH